MYTEFKKTVFQKTVLAMLSPTMLIFKLIYKDRTLLLAIFADLNDIFFYLLGTVKPQVFLKKIPHTLK